MKNFTIIFLLVSTSIFAQWEIVGGNDSYFIPNPGFGNGQSSTFIQTLQFHPTTNEPYVFFRHHKTNVKTGPSLIKFNGTAWEFIAEQFDWTVNGNTNSADFHWGFYFRTDTKVPVIFYEESFGGSPYKYHVAQRIGNTWEEIMGADNKVVNDVFLGGHRVKMVRKPNTNLPVIIGNGPIQTPNGSKSMVVHFDANTWSLLGDATFSDFGAYVSDIDYNNNTNIPYAIVSKSTNSGTVSEVWYYQGSWQTLGNPGFVPKNFGEGFRIKVNQLNGDVYVLCPEGFDNSNNSQTMTLSIRKWDGNTWSTIGTPEEIWPTSILGYDLEIHPTTGMPYVAFIEGGRTNIRKWNGSNWVAIAGEPLLGTLGEKLDLVFQPQTHIPHVISTNGRLLKAVEATASINNFNLPKVVVSPNPAKNKITVSGVSVKRVSLLDLNGRTIQISNTKTLDFSGISKGVYIISIKTAGNRIMNRKIIIQ